MLFELRNEWREGEPFREWSWRAVLSMFKAIEVADKYDSMHEL